MIFFIFAIAHSTYYKTKADHDRDRTHNLPIRSRTPYPLGHAALWCQANLKYKKWWLLPFHQPLLTLNVAVNWIELNWKLLSPYSRVFEFTMATAEGPNEMHVLFSNFLIEDHIFKKYSIYNCAAWGLVPLIIGRMRMLGISPRFSCPQIIHLLVLGNQLRGWLDTSRSQRDICR